MALKALVLLALVTFTTAAPWRCFRTCDGSTVCIGNHGQPCISPPSICIGRQQPPCVGANTVFTPYASAPPCLPPCDPPCPPPCEQPCPPPCPSYPCLPCQPPPCPSYPCLPCQPPPCY